MSLTSFIKEPEILKHILAEFPVPEFSLDYPLLAPPETENYGLIGTAFDYLLRFYLKRLYPKAIETKWVAEYTAGAKGKIVSDAKQILGIAKKERAEYLRSGELTDDLLKSTICLAKLDAIYRSGRVDEDLFGADEKDIIDLRRLYEIIPSETFADYKRVMLNPDFGNASELVGGADCDLVLDDRIIDIKTTKYLKLRQDYWAQLIGYFVLADIASYTSNKKFPETKSVGIYFSRHGILWKAPFEDISKLPNYKKFGGWFIDKAFAWSGHEQEWLDFKTKAANLDTGAD